MKIAFATKDNLSVNEHFGRCKEIAVYEIDSAGFKFLENRELPEEGGEIDRIDKRVALIKDCSIVYCVDIGPAAAARVIQNRIHPMKVNEYNSIETILLKITDVLKNPPVWLKKVMKK